MFGEIGLQRPAGSNVIGIDFITARYRRGIGYVIYVTDVKSSSVPEFKTPNLSIEASWVVELADSVSMIRLDIGDPELERQIRDAYHAGRYERRQIEVDYSAEGQGTMKGFYP